MFSLIFLRHSRLVVERGLPTKNRVLKATKKNGECVVRLNNQTLVLTTAQNTDKNNRGKKETNDASTTKQ